MKKNIFICLFLLMTLPSVLTASRPDSFITNKNNRIELYMIKHASFYFIINDYVIYFDPVSEYADYSTLPKADAIILTHDHNDHLDVKAIKQLKKKKTLFVANATAAEVLKNEKLGTKNTICLKNGESHDATIFQLEAVPAYNTTRPEFHPKGRDNGYILSVDNRRYYIAGDCEDMPEMSDLKNIDVAFLPVNQPYTMTINQAIHAAQMINPKVIYPIHMGDTDATELETKLKEVFQSEIRMRNM